MDFTLTTTIKLRTDLLTPELQLRVRVNSLSTESPNAKFDISGDDADALVGLLRSYDQCATLVGMYDEACRDFVSSLHRTAILATERTKLTHKVLDQLPDTWKASPENDTSDEAHESSRTT